MMVARYILNLFMLCVLLSGCGRSSKSNSLANELPQKPSLNAKERAVITSAIDFVQSQKDDGRLPGLTSSEHGQMVFNEKPEDLESNSLLFTLFIKVTNDPALYNYSISRTSTNDSWQLERAWKSDPSGKIVKEYPVK